MSMHCMKLLVIAVTFALPFAAKAEQFNFAVTEWSPYTSEQLPDKGLASAIVRAAFNKAGHDVVITFYPWKRALQMAKDIKVDAVFPGYFSEDRAISFSYSAPITQSELMLATLDNQPISRFYALDDLRPYRIGVVQGYVNSAEFDQADFLLKDVALSDTINLKKLLKGRVDMISIDKKVALHLLSTNDSLDTKFKKIKFLSPALLEQPVHIMVGKKKKDHALLLEEFNRGLKLIKRDGTYQKIIQRYEHF